MKTKTVEVGTLPANTKVLAAALETGRSLLTMVDEFVANQSPFDRQARLGLPDTSVQVTREIYLAYVSSQVLPWSKEEVAALKQIVCSMAQKFSRFDLRLPAEIYLVKTSGLEEGYAAYTRGTNVIVLPENMVSSLRADVSFGDPLHPEQSLEYLENTLIHECFHLFSKNNPIRRRAAYRLVHYRFTATPVALPDVPWPKSDSPYHLPQLKITNPDTPQLTAYIEMPVESPQKRDLALKRSLLPILSACGPYRGGIFFDYLQWDFIEIEKNGGSWRAVLDDAGRPVTYSTNPGSSIMNTYLNLIGRNASGELFHPDEILAQNFVFSANLPDSNLLGRIQHVLEQNGG